ncbi:hypothetical protein SNEBB_011297 [Seison nebaliae]|nr:hypothetical protein SNEBB_011297 [Seison nebaliae]
MAHIELTTYLQRFPADYHYSMIAYKRILHMMLVRFSAKYLIYILSAEATVAKYPGHMSSILYEKIIRQIKNRFATNTDNKRPLVRYYSYIAQLLMLDFDFLVHSYMVPAISQISRFNKERGQLSRPYSILRN